ncbi:MAG: hypothetical protein BWY70_00594 [Bacteroidetes bacterium ADurb.Bin408]|nr:MAG: hypothetical protein BWY70_00594 [Bacteroidetes bacterium ADurb.Bin408]
MKKFSIVFLLLMPALLFAGTGAARDEFVLVGLIILALALILGIIYLVRYIVKQVRKRNLPPESLNECDESGSSEEVM